MNKRRPFTRIMRGAFPINQDGPEMPYFFGSMHSIRKKSCPFPSIMRWRIQEFAYKQNGMSTL